jgi:radical SAM superfamily enzyme YgiQ (UPF0313 family)|tara:strand:+ start:4703 stop:6292 length:1590 start_codon:yes stop_codon:yes gene_type:complete
MKRILLLNPSARVFLFPDGTPVQRKHCPPPLGLAYIAASLLERHYEVKIVDVMAEGYDNEYVHEDSITYGLDFSKIVKRVKLEEPDIIAITVMFTYIIADILELCAILKEEFPKSKIVLGGPHPSATPIDCMKDRNIDFVIIGEGDISMTMLMDSLNGMMPMESVPSLYYRLNGEIKSTLDDSKAVISGKGWNYYRRRDTGIPDKIDDLPYPAWHLFPMQAYWNASVRSGGGDALRNRYAPMVSTRGCLHACYFCTSPLLAGYKGFQRRSNEDIVGEIRWLVENFDVKEIHFNDENFLCNRQQAKVLLKILAEEFPVLCFQVVAGLEVNAIDEETVDLMAAANFSKICLAVESGDPELQDAVINKRVKLHRIPKLVEYIKKKGIEIRGLFMIGFPDESREQIEKTIALAKGLEFDELYIAIVTPLPGTPLYDLCIDQNLFIQADRKERMRFSAACLKLPDVGPDKLEEIRRRVWQENFKRQKNMEKNRIVKDRFREYKDVSDYQRVGFVAENKQHSINPSLPLKNRRND